MKDLQKAFLLTLTAELHMLLKNIGLSINGGVLFAEAGSDMDIISEMLVKAGAKRQNVLSVAINECGRNDRLYLYDVKRYDKEEKLYEFSGKTERLSMLCVTGVVPVFLQDAKDIIIFKSDRYSAAEEDKVCNLIQSFRKYAYVNPDVIWRELNLFRSSQIYERNRIRESNLFLAMRACINVYTSYLRESVQEVHAEAIKNDLMAVVDSARDEHEKYAGDEDLAEMVMSLLRKYLKSHPEVKVGSVDAVTGELTSAVKNHKAVLYDDSLIYMSEELLKSVCGELTERSNGSGVISFLQIKRNLLRQGALKCNRNSSENFTVKKMLCNVYGQYFRPRFLIMDRKFYEISDDFSLEEEKCL